MNTQEFNRAMKGPRNGTDCFFRHAIARKALISSGVREVADAGCWWLVDLLCTEYAIKLRKDEAAGRVTGTPIIKVKVANKKARVELTYGDDEPPVHKNRIDYTDLPDGEHTFLAAVEDDHAMFYLLTEY